jgi:pyrimidine operon attenuation protein / uracil phosphoribosyltransferase
VNADPAPAPTPTPPTGGVFHARSEPPTPTPPTGGVFHARSQVLGPDDVRRGLTRIAHEIVERNRGLDGVLLVGLQRGGVWIAERLGDAIAGIEPGVRVPVGRLDVSFHRDDVGLRPVAPAHATDIPVDLDGATVVVVDDVLYTGRTVRSALDALNDYGRPRAVQLAVLVDRGHRELPIRPDYVGKNLPTRHDEEVRVTPDGVMIGQLVVGEEQ